MASSGQSDAGSEVPLIVGAPAIGGAAAENRTAVVAQIDGGRHRAWGVRRALQLRHAEGPGGGEGQVAVAGTGLYEASKRQTNVEYGRTVDDARVIRDGVLLSSIVVGVSGSGGLGKAGGRAVFKALLAGVQTVEFVAVSKDMIPASHRLFVVITA